MLLKSFIFALAVFSISADVCQQIPDSQIYDLSTFFLPTPDIYFGTLPANFNCTYKIKAPANSTYGFSAHVLVDNGLKGANDYAVITDVDGSKTTMTSRAAGPPIRYNVVPGAYITVQIVTKSVLMNSKFKVKVDYHQAKMGPVNQMKTGGEMNFFDLGKLSDGYHYFNTVTFIGTEQIFAYLTDFKDEDFMGCWDCFVMDGTIENHVKIYRTAEIYQYNFLSTTNAITVFSTTGKPFKFTLNPLSEARQFEWDSYYLLDSLRIDSAIEMFSNPQLRATQVVNFDTTGITMAHLAITSDVCKKAVIVSGPPNNSSQLLMDLTTNPEMPHHFDLQYFTVIHQDCTLGFMVY
ncbi:hypothetical protein CAEBREN_03161 [Caenorhabditis brenneri]|uniref:CUB-like domain-containing protein n=1 Tax=Caenorhabditis brenneri TaxID=135651 RepID=G0PJP3_CAEBE|nr:hypothetical protein CAEBREN_03161 [Caenorhabditis brenneri]